MVPARRNSGASPEFRPAPSRARAISSGAVRRPFENWRLRRWTSARPGALSSLREYVWSWPRRPPRRAPRRAQAQGQGYRTPQTIRPVDTTASRAAAAVATAHRECQPSARASVAIPEWGRTRWRIQTGAWDVPPHEARVEPGTAGHLISLAAWRWDGSPSPALTDLRVRRKATGRLGVAGGGSAAGMATGAWQTDCEPGS